MPHDPIRLSFKIEAYSPETLPMARLAEYMAELSTMLGERENVHFVELQDGSVGLIHEVSHVAFPKVEARARSVAVGTAPTEAMNAYRAINRKLAEDNTSASYSVQGSAGTAEIVRFPGVQAAKPFELQPVEQLGSIDGVVIGVGGRAIGKNTVPVIVDTGDAIITCSTTRGLAKQLGHYLLETQRRFQGTGQWQRDESGTWTLKRFTIHGHEELDETPLLDVVQRLRSVASPLTTTSDPLGDILGERRSESDLN
ncbi:MAG TPA: hypothetical protein VGI95_02270 [Caulobacteraceae bacterium]